MTSVVEIFEVAVVVVVVVVVVFAELAIPFRFIEVDAAADTAADDADVDDDANDEAFNPFQITSRSAAESSGCMGTRPPSAM